MKLRHTHYILNEAGEPVETDLLTWARWFGSAHNRQLQVTHLPDDVRVSTVFLGLDHNFGEGPPVLWETMIFGGPHDGYQDRYTSRQDALEGHAKALALVGVPAVPGEG